ncbi:MAG: hypothetical protein L0H25_00155 [Micrococcales bacterium]|nr:hypothetical protein [Micrococcales bacterium]
MAADLASADRHRRQLVATVSHELRDPLTAPQALLENLVDGVVTPDDEALRAALAQADRLDALDRSAPSRADPARPAPACARCCRENRAASGHEGC